MNHTRLLRLLRLLRHLAPTGALALGLTLVSPSGAHEGHDHDQPAGRRASQKQQRDDDDARGLSPYAPTPHPDRIILTWCDDPATTQAVSWRTDDSVRHGVAQLALAGPNANFQDDALNIDAQTQNLRTELGQARYHEVRFTDLQPQSLYAYRVGDGQRWSEWFHFRTASRDDAPFSFIYFGDAQNDVRSLWSRVVRQAYSDLPQARFMLHAGDLINNAHDDEQWGEWFSAGGWLNAMVPSIPVPGNHEYADLPGRSGRRLAQQWRPQFVLPTAGPEGIDELAETVYYLDYQGARIIALNSNSHQQQQAEWLRDLLRDNTQTWTIITFHHPIFSSSKSRDNAELRQLWQPIFAEFGVDLVLQGHDHSYARTGLVGTINVPAGRSARDADGTVYVVSVSGPKMYQLSDEPKVDFERRAEQTQLYQLITVDGQELRYEARTAIGEVYDAFTLRQQDDGSNLLLDRVPETPPRIFTAQPAATP